MIDKNSETWRELEGFLDSEILKTQGVVLSKGVSHDDTNYYRGYHAALMKIKGLAKETVSNPAKPTVY